MTAAAPPHARARGRRRTRRVRAFTLVELLMVLAIIGLVMGMLTGLLGRRVIRGDQVRGAAEELMGVLRATRQMAMDHKSVYGVSFNIQNAPGSTGQVLNNRSGGHWYRIIGPARDSQWTSGNWTGISNYNYPLDFYRYWCGPNATPPDGSGADTQCGWWLAMVQDDFIGEKHVLPKGEVRFLALADEDNGNNRGPSFHFGLTYPRPWFGEFIQSQGDTKPRLYSWGGYDPGMLDFPQNFAGYSWNYAARISPVTNQVINYSGFYYEGDDGPITGCCNPRDRLIANSPGWASSPTSPLTYKLFAQGAPRPLINGDWLDCVILFFPDGTAKMDTWMNLRHMYGNTAHESKDYSFYNDYDNNNLIQIGPGDMCNFISTWEVNQVPVPPNNQNEASSFEARTGTWYFTLGPDMPDDTVAFPSAQACLQAMMPLYRVGVTKAGEIKLVEVHTVQPPGTVLDSTWQGSYWENQSSGYIGYYNNLLSVPAGPCMPAEDFVTAGMLENRQWWIDP